MTSLFRRDVLEATRMDGAKSQTNSIRAPARPSRSHAHAAEALQYRSRQSLLHRD